MDRHKRYDIAKFDFYENNANQKINDVSGIFQYEILELKKSFPRKKQVQEGTNFYNLRRIFIFFLPDQNPICGLFSH